MSRMFGTDGVRGVANLDLTPELALRLARAGATVLGRGKARPVAVVGRDPRASGEMLEAAVVAGLTACGVDVHLLGVLPTPAVAYLTIARNADFGVMISASHNAMPDNGIKFFAAGGTKLSDELEDQIETVLDAESWLAPIGADIGRATLAADAVDDYVRHLAEAVCADLNGLKVVVDCANGAASLVGPKAFAAAGAQVIAINAEPTGLNINEKCGSTHLEGLSEAVIESGAALGFGFDGDADRCLAVDAQGAVVDGDAIMAILAIAMRDGQTLTDNTLVTTVMSNLGLHLAMRAEGIAVRTTDVGDRYVLEELAASQLSLGGEQSGHIVVPQFGTTGDGVLTGLQIAARIVATGKSLAQLASVVSVVPQVLINVRVTDKNAVAVSDSVQAAVAVAVAKLGDQGRVLLRPSGTEPLVRVMVEAIDGSQAQQIAQELAELVAAH